MTVWRTISRVLRPHLDQGTGPQSCTAMLACHTGTPSKASAHLFTVRIVDSDSEPTRSAR